MPRRTRSLPTADELSDTCPLCRKLIHPSQIARLDNERSRCPHCGGIYTYPTSSWSQLHHGS